jgi:hypothetical protein
MQFYRLYSVRMQELRSAISKALWVTNARTMDRWLRAANARSPLSLFSPAVSNLKPPGCVYLRRH